MWTRVDVSTHQRRLHVTEKNYYAKHIYIAVKAYVISSSVRSESDGRATFLP